MPKIRGAALWAFCSPLAFGQTANPVSGFYLLRKDGECEDNGGGEFATLPTTPAPRPQRCWIHHGAGPAQRPLA